MRVHTTAAMGAYLSTFASCIPTILYATLLAGQYTTPAIYCEVTASFTNTAPVDAYRGAGRPEATYVVERIVHQAALDLGIAQDEIRRRNFIRTFPYQTPVALIYDTGNYDATLDEAMKMADVAGFPGAQGRSGEARQAARHRLRVVHRGLRHRAVEHRRRARRARGAVRGGRGARASDRQRDGVHRLAQPRPGARDDVRAGRRGAGSASRSRTSTSSTATPAACRSAWARTARARCRSAARRSSRRSTRSSPRARRSPRTCSRRPRRDIEFKDGKFTVAGTDRSKTFGEIALTAYVPHNYPLDKLEPGLERDGVLRSDELHVPGGHAHLRSRDRSRTPASSRSSRSPRATTSATSSIR